MTFPRALGVAAAILVASAGALVGFVDSGSAAAAPLGITSPANGSFHSSSAVSFTGSKDAGSTVHLTTANSTDPHCIIAPGDEQWECTITFADGEHTVTATEYLDIPGEDQPDDEQENPTEAPAENPARDVAGSAVASAQLLAESSVTVRVLSAPTLEGPSLGTGLVTGRGFVGAGVVVAYDGPETGELACGTVQGGGYWSCALPVATSGDYSVSVRQSWPGEPGDLSASSPVMSVTIDKAPPGAPVITSPAAGARISTQPTSYAGSGESGGRIDVFVDGTLVCSATVSAGAWTCSGTGVPDGTRKVQAIQWDAAGNPSGASAAVTVTFGRASTPQQPKPGQVPPSAPIPTDPPSATPTPSPTPTPEPSIPFLPPPIGGDSGLPPFQTWGTPTHYGDAIPTLAQTWARGNWVSGPLLAIGFILLAALPLRLLFATLGDRIRWRPQRLAGRNRTDVNLEDHDKPVFNPWLVGAGALAGAAVIASLAGGLQGEVRYLRLVAAIGFGLVILNLVGVVISTKLSSRLLGNETALRLVPTFLLIATASALISRTGGIQPPVIIGAVVAATFAAGMPPRDRGIVAFTQLASMTVLSVAAWLLHGWIGPVEGFWMSLWSESLAALCLAGLGSVVLLLLPVSSLPGRTLFEWSKPVWLATAFVAVTFAAVVIAGSAAFPLPWVLGGAFVFAAVSIAAWSWTEFVEPRHPLLASAED